MWFGLAVDGLWVVETPSVSERALRFVHRAGVQLQCAACMGQQLYITVQHCTQISAWFAAVAHDATVFEEGFSCRSKRQMPHCRVKSTLIPSASMHANKYKPSSLLVLSTVLHNPAQYKPKATRVHTSAVSRYYLRRRRTPFHRGVSGGHGRYAWATRLSNAQASASFLAG